MNIIKKETHGSTADESIFNTECVCIHKSGVAWKGTNDIATLITSCWEHNLTHQLNFLGINLFVVNFVRLSY